MTSPLIRWTSTGTSASGHVKAFDSDTGFVFESIEILHGKSITPAMVRRVRDDSKARPANKHKLLAATPVGDMEVVMQVAKRVGSYDYQVIVSSVLDGIKWVLSLLDGMDGFVERYAGLVEDDDKIKYVHKMAWNNAARTTAR